MTVADRRPLPLPGSLMPLKKTKVVGSGGVEGDKFRPRSCTVTCVWPMICPEEVRSWGAL